MQITKHAHACVEVGDAADSVLIDPGTFTPNAAELMTRSRAVLYTHEHFDHLDADLLTRALAAQPELEVWGPPGVTSRWRDDHPERVHTVTNGDTFEVNGVSVEVYGSEHARIHADIQQVDNVGYLLGGAILHPGDAYHVPPVPVATLLLPTSGPRTKLGEAVEYVRAVAPATLIQIHELMLSELGQRSTAMFLSPTMLSDVPLTVLEPGTSMDL